MSSRLPPLTVAPSRVAAVGAVADPVPAGGVPLALRTPMPYATNAPPPPADEHPPPPPSLPPPSQPQSSHQQPAVVVTVQPVPVVPLATAAAASPAPPLAVSVAPPPRPLAVTDDQKRLVKALLSADVRALYEDFNQTDWNFAIPVIGRTAPQTPLGLLLRPELNYGNLSRMSRTDQYKLVAHVLALPEGFTPRLDSLDQKPGPFRQTMNSSVLQAVYQGRVDLVELLEEVAADRARKGTGVAFDLREKFFPTKLTLLHMAAHDGRLEMSRWIVQRWKALAEASPDDPRNTEFHPDCGADGAGGQTPLFFTFARGSVSVDLARFFVDECDCDFFKVFRLKPNNPPAAGAPAQELNSSPFSLAIQLAPAFAAEQLGKKTEIMGTRISSTVVKTDFVGVTLKDEQVTTIQNQVDILNAEHSAKRERLEGKEFLRQATELLKDYVETKYREKAKRTKSTWWCGRNRRVAAFTEEAKNELPTGGDAAPPQQQSTTSLDLDVCELRFVSQEAQGGRPPKDRWDGFFYDSVPRSALELMVLYHRSQLLLTPVMLDIQARLWKQLYLRYFVLLIGWMLFGILFTTNTVIWPRTSSLLGSNMLQPLVGNLLVPDPHEWTGVFFVVNFTCILLALGLGAFHSQAIYSGANWNWFTGGPVRFVTTLYDNVTAAFRSGSSRLDLLIWNLFFIIEALQWSLLCHVPQFAVVSSTCSATAPPFLNESSIAALQYLSAILHLLLGLKLLELLSLFEVVGVLFSTLIGMVKDVGKFLLIFMIGFLAFVAAGWVVHKDVFSNTEKNAGLNGPAALVTTDLVTGQVIEPVPDYTFAQSFNAVLLWVFANFEFESFEHTTVPASMVLARFLFFLFMLLMVIVMLNLMIAMFSSTFSAIVADAKGEWLVRSAGVLCQLLRMVGGEENRKGRAYVLEMGVDNNCGIDRVDNATAELSIGGDGGETHDETEDLSATIQAQFQLLHASVAKLRAELKDQRREREREKKNR